MTQSLKEYDLLKQSQYLYRVSHYISYQIGYVLNSYYILHGINIQKNTIYTQNIMKIGINCVLLTS